MSKLPLPFWMFLALVVRSPAAPESLTEPTLPRSLGVFRIDDSQLGELVNVTYSRIARKLTPNAMLERSEGAVGSERRTLGQSALVQQDLRVVPRGKLGEFAHATLVTRAADGFREAPSSCAATHTHPGVDIVADCGTPVYPFADGYVADRITSDKDPDFDSLGYMVLVRHTIRVRNKDTYSIYLHLQLPPQLGVGDPVRAAATVVGVVGRSGMATGCHLHFEIRHFATRYLRDPEWNNIYGKGDQRDAVTFIENWEHPTLFLYAGLNPLLIAGRRRPYGVLRSTDGWKSWEEVLSVNETVDAAVGIRGEVVIGTGGGIFRSSDEGKTWRRVCSTEPGEPNVRSFAAGPTYVLAVGGGGILRSLDNGRTWVPSNVGLALGTQRNAGSVFRAPSGPVLAGTYDGIFRSTDDGASWRRAGSVAARVLSFTLDQQGVMFAGTAGRGIFRSIDSGQTWTTTAREFAGEWVSRLVASARGHIFAAIGRRGVFRSVDGGTTWRNVLAVGQGETIPYAIVATSNGEIYAGAGACCPVKTVSVFRSTDEGKTWASILDVKNRDVGIGAILTTPGGAILVGLTFAGE